MKKILLITVFSLIAIPFVNAQWQQTNGPTGGGNITCLTTLGTNIFAGTYSDGVFKSTDNGSTWTAVNTGLSAVNDYFIESITGSGANLFAGTMYGKVFYSTNYGSSWTDVSSGLPAGLQIFSMAIIGNRVFAASNFNGVFSSSDNGATWTPVGTMSGNPNVYQLVVRDSTLFAGTQSGGVFYSTDNGSTWTDISIGGVQHVYGLALTGTTLFAGTYGGGMYSSINNGISWDSINSGLVDPYIRSLFSNGTTLFAGTNSGIFTSNNNGNTWTADSSIASGNFDNEAFAVLGTNLFAGTTGRGIFKSTDNGTSWIHSSNGIKLLPVKSLAVSGSNLLVGCDLNGGLQVSSDNGNSWVATGSGITNADVNAFAQSGASLYAATFSGLFMSANNGSTWVDISAGLTSPNVKALAVAGTKLYAGTDADGILVSSDNGVSWTNISGNLYDLNIRAIAISGTNLFVATQYSGVYLSTNNGATWTPTGSMSGSVTCMVASGTKIFAGTDEFGVYFSNDNGTTWTRVNSGLGQSTAIRSLILNGTDLIAGTGGGVFLSAVNDTTWTPLNGGLNLNVSSIAKNSTHLFAGTNTGVYKIPLSSNTISGKVKTATGPAFSGFVKLYSFDINKPMVQVDSVQIDSLGNYTFYNVLYDHYIIQANCTGTYTNTLPTYSDSSATWDSASVVSVSIGSYVMKDIYLIEVPTQTGSATISGFIMEGDGYKSAMAPGNPVGGIDVGVRKKPKLSMVAMTVTDAAGQYSFSNIEPGDYVLYVDIAGLPMASTYDISITGSENIVNKNFMADSTHIFKTGATEISDTEPAKKQFGVYPNPFNNAIYIINSENTNETALVSITDVTGKVVYSEKIKMSAQTQVDLREIQAGLYFMEIKYDNTTEQQKIIKLK